MSATSSSPAAAGSSPLQPWATRPQHNCLECKRLKRACDKGFPCSKCVKANRTCEYKDPCDDGVYGPISAAKDIHSLTFGTLLDILVSKPRVKEAVSLYFGGVNTWFTIVERASFERDLEAGWDNLPAERSAMALCMALVARPPNQKSSKGMGDTVYPTTKAILGLVQSKLPMSVHMLQAELLVAMYEFSQAMPQQAYMSLGHCLQMTKAFGWHNAAFWTPDRQASNPGELKLNSILCLLNVAYDQAYPMHTTGLAPVSPFQFGGQGQGFREANGDQIDGMAFPEGTSAWYLSNVLQQLSNPTMPAVVDPKTLSSMIFQHIKIMTSMGCRVGTSCIAFMKLHQPGLFGGIGPMSIMGQGNPQAVNAIRVTTDMIHGKAAKLAQSDDQLNRGLVDPSWAFAMCYASQLLVSHGDNVLQDANWYQKVTILRNALDKNSTANWLKSASITVSLALPIDYLTSKREA
ncbi:uncharacterized protein B0H64DRAFT_414237 [Chaetomium fimeti]|uniref:Zn(2)-C6 fungal-type domain-containing protein n=1 Tax=Chaetomium fimeti TaxID=1854472 RepID=A0AAE0LWH8_9PEZI|nr:hypothetical protein B0H64DRAFT_414237 [Chaetomium fimeti]